MRITRTRALLAAALPIAAGAVFFTVATPAANAAGAAFPAHYAAPYLQVSSGDVGDMTQDMSSSGTKFYTLAFLTPSSGCNMVFEADGGGPGTFVNQIRSLQAAGGNVAISFGGAAGGEVAQTCTNTSSLTAAYANVVNTNGIQRLDFDIEGSVLGDTASTSRRDAALAALQAQNPAVQVDFTLAVAPNGLPSQEMGLLQDAKNHGVRVSVVNIMTMDFGNGQSAINDAISAANATSGQLAGLYGISTTAAFNMMSLTPIAGQNDDNEFFSQGDAQTLETYASQHGVAGLSFWEVDAFDKPVGFNYSRIFNAITGGGSPPPPPPPPGNGTPIHGFGGKCVDVAGANSADGTQVQLFTCNGTNAQSWTHTGATYQALGKCLDVAAAGTANGTKVQLFTCNGTGAQSWTHTSSNQLVNTNSGKCLDATGVSSADGTPLQIWSCSGGANQVWTGP